MQFSTCSYSFHRLFASGKMDIFGYITWCKEAGMTQLDPWNRHLSSDPTLAANLYNPWDHRMGAGGNDRGFLDEVNKAADRIGLPFGCIAVDGAHIYEPTEEGRAATRANSYKWLDVAEYLRAQSIRVDAGGPDNMPDDVLAIIADGYSVLVDSARSKGVKVLIENHWGPTKYPENVVKILKAVDGLGYLFDTNNWAPEIQEHAWEMCIPYATLSHFKTFVFDAAGYDPSVNLAKAVHLLLDTGYEGCWGIESCPEAIGEREAAEKTRDLIRRIVVGAPKPAS